MSTAPDAPPAAEPVAPAAAPPIGAVVLAGIDFAYAAWLLVYIGVGLAFHADMNNPANREPIGVPANAIADFWSGWMAPLRGLMFLTTQLATLFWLALVIPSIGSLFGSRVRSAPRIFRVLLGGTVTLALVFAALSTLSYRGLLDFGWD